jgi:CheY-like chemotaxis protein
MILVVDDEADARNLVGKILEGAGATIKAVSSAAEALEYLRSGSADVLVSDIGMPGEDGYSLIRQLRTAGWPSNRLPAIALTAYTSDNERWRALLIGFQIHLPKPIDVDELLAAVNLLSPPTNK